MNNFPLGDYLARIGLPSAPKSDEAGLLAITAAQARSIPFENLDPFLGKPVLLDPQSILQKLVYRQRGGYCFELNGLLDLVLRHLGFEAVPHLGRVATDQGEPNQRSHLVLEVSCQNRSWLVDCGFGGRSPRFAMPLEADRLEIQNGEAYRLLRHSECGWMLQSRGEGWQNLYAFGHDSFRAIDLEMANFYTNMWPAQRFRQHLVAALVTENGRLTLLDTKFRERNRQQDETLAVETITAMNRILVQSLGLPEREIDQDRLAQRLGFSLS